LTGIFPILGKSSDNTWKIYHKHIQNELTTLGEIIGMGR
jgi:hypothetical protein